MNPKYVNLKSAPPGATKKSIGELQHIAEIVTKGEVRLAIRTMYPTTRVDLYGHGQHIAQDMSDASVNALSGLMLGDLFYLHAKAVDPVAKPVISPFTLVNFLAERGMNVTFEDLCPQNVGSTAKTNMFGHELPQGRTAVFEGNNDTMCGPIVGSFIDSNYMRLQNAELLPFIPEVAKIASVMSMFFELKLGKVNRIIASEAWNMLLGLGNTLANLGNVSGYVCSEMANYIRELKSTDTRGWDYVSAYGNDFSHLVYKVFAKNMAKERRGPFVQFLDYVMNQMITMRDGSQYFNAHTLVCQVVPMSVPVTMDGAKMSIKTRDVSVSQAYGGLSLARGARGENDKEKGAGLASAYVEVSLPISVSRTISLASNIRRFVRPKECVIIIPSEKKPGPMVLNCVNSLLMLDYKGTVVIPSGHINATAMRAGELIQDKFVMSSVGEPEKKDKQKETDEVKEVVSIEKPYSTYCTHYLNSNFVVIEADVMSYVSPSWIEKMEMLNNDKKSRKRVWLPPSNTVILDMRAMGGSTYTKKKHSAYIEQLSINLEQRLLTWDAYQYPVVSRCGLFQEMVEIANAKLNVYSSVDPHNLVVYCAYGTLPQREPMPGTAVKGQPDSGENWYYHITSTPVVKEVCAQSLLANVARCNKALCESYPYRVFRSEKFKVPVLSLKGLGKMVLADTAYEFVNVQADIVAGRISALDAFDNASLATKALMMRDEDLARQIGLSDVESVSVVPENVKREDGGSSSGVGGIDTIANAFSAGDDF